MKKLTELETDKDFEEFGEILSKVSNGNIIGTLRQVVTKPDGSGYNYVDVQQAVSQSKTLVQVNENYLYITVQNVRSDDVRKIQTMWNMVLQRGTQCFVKGKANDYMLTVDLVRNELETEGRVYCISAIQPVFMSSEGNRDLTVVFAFDNVRCAKDEVSMYDVEYEAAIREESGNDVYKISDSDDEDAESEGYDENDGVLNTDEYTVGMSNEADV